MIGCSGFRDRRQKRGEEKAGRVSSSGRGKIFPLVVPHPRRSICAGAWLFLRHARCGRAAAAGFCLVLRVHMAWYEKACSTFTFDEKLSTCRVKTRSIAVLDYLHEPMSEVQ